MNAFRNRARLLIAGGLVALAFTSTSCEKRDVAVSRVASVDETYALTSSWSTFAQGADRGPGAKLDLLFMIDNSFSMGQRKLTASFPEMLRVLEELPGGLPDLHIGVVSSDMGAGAFDAAQVPTCVYGGDQGKLQVAPRACAATGLADHYIAVRTDPATGGRITNYGDGALEEVFACIAPLGQTGCGFEHPFASVMRALGVDGHGPAPSWNDGFLREDATLGVVLVTNEDDCSAPMDSQFFDPKSMKVGDPYGPLTSFRCNAFGHICQSKAGEVPPSMTSEVTYADCRSNENGPLIKVAAFTKAINSLKADPARVFIAVIGGPATPYTVSLDGLPTNDDPAGVWPQIQHSCTEPDGTYADPGVRLSEAVQSFGPHGVFESICSASFAPSLAAIAQGISAPLATPCVAVPNDVASCLVVDRWVVAAHERHARLVPSCAEAAGEVPCWSFVDDAKCGAGTKRLDVTRTGTTVPDHLFTAVSCTTTLP